MQVKVRRQGAVRSTTVMLAVGISEDGYRELLGLEVAFGETAEAWHRFIQGLKQRGLSGEVSPVWNSPRATRTKASGRP